MDIRQLGLQDNMFTLTSQTRTISLKPCTVLCLGYVIQSFLFVLIQFLHCEALLKLARVCSTVLFLKMLLYVSICHLMDILILQTWMKSALYFLNFLMVCCFWKPCYVINDLYFVFLESVPFLFQFSVELDHLPSDRKFCDMTLFFTFSRVL